MNWPRLFWLDAPGRSILIKQLDISDCAAACLASVATHYDIHIPIARIRQMASTDKRGTTVLGIIEAAGLIGFQAKGVKGRTENLHLIPLPAIAHVITSASLHHFVVIHSISSSHIRVMDPSHGKMVQYSYKEFCKIWSGVLVLLQPGQNFRPGTSRITMGKRLRKLITPHWKAVIHSLLGAMTYALLGIVSSIYVQKIVDDVLINRSRDFLDTMSVVTIVSILLSIVIGFLKSMVTLRMIQIIDENLMLGYYRHLLQLPQSFFDTMQVGEILSRFNDAAKVRSFINDVVINLAGNMLTIAVSFALMCTYNWKLALIVMLILPIDLILHLVTSRLNKKVDRQLKERTANLDSQLVESLQGISTIKCFGLESHSNLKTEEKFHELRQTILASSKSSQFSNFSTEFASRLFVVVLFWSGAGFVLNKSITPGELLTFYALLAYFSAPVANLIAMSKTIQSALIAAERLYDTMDLLHESNENKDVISPHLIGDFRFNNVHFRYGTKPIVFSGLNLSIPRGRVTAIVGESGSGKSTLASILQKLYPVFAGTVHIGEREIGSVDTASLRKCVASVPQKIDLFSGSIIDNIALGCISPDMKKVRLICESLGILEFFEGLPLGFNSLIGEHGVMLSSGQKQQIAIARALYRDPEVLILDEATSSLDSTSEKLVQNALTNLRDLNKTIIVLAHRLSSVFDADKIVVLNKGRVAEEGTHHQLLANRQDYFRMWQNQYRFCQEARNI